MPNQIMGIAPYWLDEAGTWVFDDPATDLKQEPFVEGVPEMSDNLVADIPDGVSVSLVARLSHRGIPVLEDRRIDLGDDTFPF